MSHDLVAGHGKNIAYGAAIALWMVLMSFFLAQQANAGRGASYSVYNSGAKGAKALFLTLGELGYKADTTSRPVRSLSSDRVLVVIKGQRSLSKKTWEQLLSFMSAGGRLVWLSVGDIEPGGSKVLTHNSSRGGNDAGHIQSTGYGRFLAGGRFRSKDRVRSELGGAVGHVGDSDGSLLLSRRFGRGELVAIADPDLLTNKGLKRNRGNLDLLLAVLGTPGKAGSITFYEASLDAPSNNMAAGGLAYLPVRVWQALPLWLKLGLAQLVLAATILLYSDGKRLGPPLRVPETVDAGDYIAAVAGLYQRAGARKLALGRIYRNFLRRSAGGRWLGAGGEKVLLQIIKERSGKPEEADALLKTCGESVLPDGSLTEREMLALANRLAVLRKELGTNARRRRGA